ncbi:hypothetical protein IFM89_025103 [Coptis chinensis]|uniref:Hexosyltransferase n=1 Tax=Coptis chinensis TaxID=261450 RepID=A0A835LX47_9MAGN|nr:hypothetical protein IFM89_025103 [Coptis chinensis]
MAAGANGMKLYLLVLTLLSLTLHLLFLTSSFHLKYHLVHHRQKPYLAQKKHSSPIFDFLAARLEGKEIKIGLVNTHVEEENKWKELGETTVVHFDRVPKDRRWEEYFTDWVEEDEKWATPKCPDIPMPSYKSYGEFNVVVVKMPCGNVIQRKGIRDVFRLQVNLVAANLAVQSVKINGTDQNLFVVFIGTCGPMWEIFRCDDLLRHEGDFWIYKPELRRLKQKVLMPVGACQLAVSPRKHGDGKITYDFTKLSSPIDHPKEAYVTVIHTSEEYVCGAIVLAQSIVQTNSTKDLVLLADESITKESRLALRAAGWIIKDIERIRSPYAETYAYNEWNYSKLRIWQLTEYDKLIFIDSDFIVLENIDEFFVYPQLSAVRNDEKVIFNSGIMLIEPSDCIFEMLMNERYTLMSYNGGDQVSLKAFEGHIEGQGEGSKARKHGYCVVSSWANEFLNIRS